MKVIPICTFSFVPGSILSYFYFFTLPENYVFIYSFSALFFFALLIYGIMYCVYVCVCAQFFVLEAFLVSLELAMNPF